MGPDTGAEIVGMNLGLFPDILALRPREAKKPAPLVEGVGARERTDEGGVPVLPALELDRVGWLRDCGGFKAREGYGRVGGSPGGVMSRYAPWERSVATVASGRVGNVASEAIEDREVKRGLGVNGRAEGPRVCVFGPIRA